MPCDGDPVLWPVRPRPQPDEVFTGWLARIAQAHGIAPDLLLAHLRSRYHLGANRDLDTDPCYQLIAEVSRRTAIRYSRIAVMTLRWHVYPWYARSARNQRGGSFGFCSFCWAQDAVPYLRRAWRLPWMPCLEHKLPLSRQCQSCRWPPGVESLAAVPPLTQCSQCGFDLRDGPPAHWPTTATPDDIAASLVWCRVQFEDAEPLYRIGNSRALT